MLKTLLILMVVSTFLHAGEQSGKEKEINSLGFTEAEAYKLLYENQIKANDAVLKTIFYALGGLATAILAVFASNWWFNEKKVRDVARDIDRQIKDLANTALAELTQKISFAENALIQKNAAAEAILIEKLREAVEKLKTEVSNDQKGLEERVESRLSALTEATNRQMDAGEKLNGERVENLKDLIERMESKLLEKIRTDTKSLSDKVSRENTQLRMRVYENDADIALNKQNYTVAFSSFLKVAECWLDLSYGPIHQLHIDQMFDAAKKMTYAWKWDLKKSEEVLRPENVPDPEKAAEILSLIKKLPLEG